jgi:flagellar motor protein MotB
MRQGVVVAVGVVALLVGGCAASRQRDRVSVLQAENIDLRQRSEGLERQVQESNAQQDIAMANLQVKESELRKWQQEAGRHASAATQLAQAQAELDRARLEAQEAQRRAAEAERRALAARPASVPAAAPVPYKDAAQVEAFRRDLAEKIRTAGVQAPVEVRTMRTGEQRVAVVLEDAFPPGRDTLAANAKAVEAVARLGQLIQQDYPRSVVHIEGHTDSDPIRKSGWESNEALSKARAESVKKLLLGVGLESARVETEGLGARTPIARGNTPRAKAQNRRVEIYITPR